METPSCFSICLFICQSAVFNPSSPKKNWLSHLITIFLLGKCKQTNCFCFDFPSVQYRRCINFVLIYFLPSASALNASIYLSIYLSSTNQSINFTYVYFIFQMEICKLFILNNRISSFSWKSITFSFYSKTTWKK